MHVVGCGRCEEDGRAGKVFRRTPTAGRYALQDGLVSIRVVAQRFRIVGADITRRDGIDVDALGGPLVGKRHGQLADAALRCVDAGAEVVLVNCVGARLTLAYVEALVGLGVPVGAYANAGNPNDRIGWSAGPPGPERYTCFAQQWRNAGASVIGGCCGTTPAHIAALHSALSPTP